VDKNDAADWRMIENDGFIGLVGPIFYLPFDDGIGRFRFDSEAKHKNRGGFVQGGMLMTFADRALGMTARKGHLLRPQATVQLNMNFMRTAKIGDVVEMECRVIRETRSLVFLEGKISVEESIIATAQGVWKIIASERS
jgi:acyl-coenzyme A thioesterase PaaI-like protein